MDNRGHQLINNMRSAIRRFNDRYFTSNDLLNLLNNNMNSLERNMEKAPKINSVKNKPKSVEEIISELSEAECIEMYNTLEENLKGEKEPQDIRGFTPVEIEEVRNELGLSSETTDQFLIETLQRTSKKSKATLKAVKLTKQKIYQLIDFLTHNKPTVPDLGGTSYKD